MLLQTRVVHSQHLLVPKASSQLVYLYARLGGRCPCLHALMVERQMSPELAWLLMQVELMLQGVELGFGQPLAPVASGMAFLDL